MLFIDGNYENFDKLSRFPVETWCGGKVHKIRETVIHLMRGEVYCIEGNTVFVMGGGYSIDSTVGQKVFRGGRRKCPLKKNTTVPL